MSAALSYKRFFKRRRKEIKAKKQAQKALENRESEQGSGSSEG